MSSSMNKRQWLGQCVRWAGAGSLLALGLGGCASVNQLSVEVRSFGSWPAGRKPGSYAIERLPSQQNAGAVQQGLEDAAREALAAAGFSPVAEGATPDVLVQLGAQVNRADASPWDDPLWWSGGWGYWRNGPWRGPVWRGRLYLENPRYERQVALLLRDRASGQPLYEAHASTEGYLSSAEGLLGPMLRAAMAEFPEAKAESRLVRVQL